MKLKHDILRRYLETFEAICKSKGKIADRVRTAVGNCGLRLRYSDVLLCLKRD